jgi:MFS family permease
VTASAPCSRFYAGWRLVGLAAGITAATAVAVGLWWWDRHRGRKGLMVRIGLALVLLQAVVGLLSGSERLYLAQPVVMNGAWALAFLGSAAVGRPLVGVFAGELADIPEEVRRPRRTGGRSASPPSLGCVLPRQDRAPAVGAGPRLHRAVPARQRPQGTPVVLVLFARTTWWARRAFRRSDEWRWALQVPADPPPAPTP